MQKDEGGRAKGGSRAGMLGSEFGNGVESEGGEEKENEGRVRSGNGNVRVPC